MQALRSIPPETNLVALCARSFLSAEERHRLQSALAGPVDWAALERAADRHSIAPLVAWVLKQYGGDLVPLEVREQLDYRLRRAARQNLIWLAEWQRTLNAFESTGIRAISLKGPAFALQAYGNIALRESTDLDFLVRPDDMVKAQNALAREGYQLRFPASAGLRSRNRQFDLIHPERGTLIDLHWGALHAMFPFQLPMDALFQSARTEHCENFSYLSLSPEHLLLYLCAHGTKHCWLHLRWLCDVACYVRTAPTLDWNLCMQEAHAANCDLVMQHSLLLAGHVLGLELAATVKGYCDAKARTLADAASSFPFSKDDALSHGKALRYHLAFARHWRDRIRFIFERIFVPEEQDWHEVRLPHSLRFVYYAVRPIRFMLERLASAALGPRAEGY